MFAILDWKYLSFCCLSHFLSILDLWIPTRVSIGSRQQILGLGMTEKFYLVGREAKSTNWIYFLLSFARYPVFGFHHGLGFTSSLDVGSLCRFRLTLIYPLGHLANPELTGQPCIPLAPVRRAVFKHREVPLINIQKLMGTDIFGSANECVCLFFTQIWIHSWLLLPKNLL